jgi:hypothetical protein
VTAVLALLFPLALLGLLMLMGWIEAPLSSDAVSERLPDFLETATPEEIEVFVSRGLQVAMERYWRRRRVRRLLPGG